MTNSPKTSATHFPRRTEDQNQGKPGSTSAITAERSTARKVIGELVKLHDFPVPETLVEHQMDVRLERVVRSWRSKVWIPGRQCGLGDFTQAAGRPGQG